MRKLNFLFVVAMLVACGGSPTNTTIILPTSSGQLVVAPPTRAAGSGDATPSSDAVQEDPLPVGEGGVTLPENIPGLEKTPAGLPVYRVEVAAVDWARFDTVDRAALDALADAKFPAVFSSGSVQLEATIRLRGLTSRYYPKKSFRIDFPKGTDFGGRTEINLLATPIDKTFILEPFFWEMMAQSGALAPFARKVELRVNGVYYGLMTDVESIGSRRFLRNHALPDDATIFRLRHNYDFSIQPDLYYYEDRIIQIKNKTSFELGDAVGFVEALNHTPQDQFAAWLAARIDVPRFINYMVGDALISNDSVQSSDSYLVHDTTNDFWWYVPWDLNNSSLISYENYGHAQVTDSAYAKHTPLPWTIYEYAFRPLSHDETKPRWGVLSTRVIDTPEFRAIFIQRLKEVLDTKFNSQALNPYVDNLYAQIEASALADSYADPVKIKGGPAWLKQYIADRHDYLVSYLPQLESLGQSGVYINEVGSGFVELYNSTGSPYDVSGYYVSNNLHTPTQYTLPAGTVVPPGGFFVVKAVSISASGGEVGLFKPTTLDEALAGDSGVIDLVYFGPVSSSASYARTPTGSETWATQNPPSPGS